MPFEARVITSLDLGSYSSVVNLLSNIKGSAVIQSTLSPNFDKSLRTLMAATGKKAGNTFASTLQKLFDALATAKIAAGNPFNKYGSAFGFSEKDIHETLTNVGNISKKLFEGTSKSIMDLAGLTEKMQSQIIASAVSKAEKAIKELQATVTTTGKLIKRNDGETIAQQMTMVQLYARAAKELLMSIGQGASPAVAAQLEQMQTVFKTLEHQSVLIDRASKLRGTLLANMRTLAKDLAISEARGLQSAMGLDSNGNLYRSVQNVSIGGTRRTSPDKGYGTIGRKVQYGNIVSESKLNNSGLVRATAGLPKGTLLTYDTQALIPSDVRKFVEQILTQGYVHNGLTYKFLLSSVGQQGSGGGIMVRADMEAEVRKRLGSLSNEQFEAAGVHLAKNLTYSALNSTGTLPLVNKSNGRQINPNFLMASEIKEETVVPRWMKAKFNLSEVSGPTIDFESAKTLTTPTKAKQTINDGNIFMSRDMARQIGATTFLMRGAGLKGLATTTDWLGVMSDVLYGEDYTKNNKAAQIKKRILQDKAIRNLPVTEIGRMYAEKNGLAAGTYGDTSFWLQDGKRTTLPTIGELAKADFIVNGSITKTMGAVGASAEGRGTAALFFENVAKHPELLGYYTPSDHSTTKKTSWSTLEFSDIANVKPEDVKSLVANASKLYKSAFSNPESYMKVMGITPESVVGQAIASNSELIKKGPYLDALKERLFGKVSNVGTKEAPKYIRSGGLYDQMSTGVLPIESRNFYMAMDLSEAIGRMFGIRGDVARSVLNGEVGFKGELGEHAIVRHPAGNSPLRNNVGIKGLFGKYAISAQRGDILLVGSTDPLALTLTGADFDGDHAQAIRDAAYRRMAGREVVNLTENPGTGIARDNTPAGIAKSIETSVTSRANLGLITKLQQALTGFGYLRSADKYGVTRDVYGNVFNASLILRDLSVDAPKQGFNPAGSELAAWMENTYGQKLGAAKWQQLLLMMNSKGQADKWSGTIDPSKITATDTAADSVLSAIFSESRKAMAEGAQAYAIAAGKDTATREVTGVNKNIEAVKEFSSIAKEGSSSLKNFKDLMNIVGDMGEDSHLRKRLQNILNGQRLNRTGVAYSVDGEGNIRIYSNFTGTNAATAQVKDIEAIDKYDSEGNFISRTTTDRGTKQRIQYSTSGIKRLTETGTYKMEGASTPAIEKATANVDLLNRLISSKTMRNAYTALGTELLAIKTSKSIPLLQSLFVDSLYRVDKNGERIGSATPINDKQGGWGKFILDYYAQQTGQGGKLFATQNAITTGALSGMFGNARDLTGALIDPTTIRRGKIFNTRDVVEINGVRYGWTGTAQMSGNNGQLYSDYAPLDYLSNRSVLREGKGGKIKTIDYSKKQVSWTDMGKEVGKDIGVANNFMYGLQEAYKKNIEYLNRSGAGAKADVDGKLTLMKELESRGLKMSTFRDATNGKLSDAQLVKTVMGLAGIDGSTKGMSLMGGTTLTMLKTLGENFSKQVMAKANISGIMTGANGNMGFGSGEFETIAGNNPELSTEIVEQAKAIMNLVTGFNRGTLTPFLNNKATENSLGIQHTLDDPVRARGANALQNLLASQKYNTGLGSSRQQKNEYVQKQGATVSKQELEKMMTPTPEELEPLKKQEESKKKQEEPKKQTTSKKKTPAKKQESLTTTPSSLKFTINGLEYTAYQTANGRTMIKGSNGKIVANPLKQNNTSAITIDGKTYTPKQVGKKTVYVDDAGKIHSSASVNEIITGKKALSGVTKGNMQFYGEKSDLEISLSTGKKKKQRTMAADSNTDSGTTKNIKTPEVATDIRPVKGKGKKSGASQETPLYVLPPESINRNPETGANPKAVDRQLGTMAAQREARRIQAEDQVLSNATRLDAVATELERNAAKRMAQSAEFLNVDTRDAMVNALRERVIVDTEALLRALSPTGAEKLISEGGTVRQLAGMVRALQTIGESEAMAQILTDNKLFLNFASSSGAKSAAQSVGKGLEFTRMILESSSGFAKEVTTGSIKKMMNNSDTKGIANYFAAGGFNSRGGFSNLGNVLDAYNYITNGVTSRYQQAVYGMLGENIIKNDAKKFEGLYNVMSNAEQEANMFFTGGGFGAGRFGAQDIPVKTNLYAQLLYSQWMRKGNLGMSTLNAVGVGEQINRTILQAKAEEIMQAAQAKANQSYTRGQRMQQAINGGFALKFGFDVTLGKAGSFVKSVVGQGAGMLSYQALTMAILGASQLVQYMTDYNQQLRYYKKLEPDWGTKEIRAYNDSLKDVAFTYGKTMPEIAEASMLVTRSGYSPNPENTAYIEGANKAMTELALLLSTVADEEMEVGDAADSIISAVKGYAVADKDVVTFSDHYVDMVNTISNNAAVTSNDITTNLGKTASVAANVGLDVDQTVAMLATMASTNRSASRSATALKTLSTRFGLVGTGATIGDRISDAARGMGVEMLKEDGSRRDFEEVFRELSAAYMSNDVEQSAKDLFLYRMGGATQSAMVGNILQNWNDYERLLALGRNSEGSAEKSAEALVTPFQRMGSAASVFATNFVGQKQMAGLVGETAKAFLAVAPSLGTVAAPLLFGTVSSMGLSGQFRRIGDTLAGKADITRNMAGLDDLERKEYKGLLSARKRQGEFTTAQQIRFDQLSNRGLTEGEYYAWLKLADQDAQRNLKAPVYARDAKGDIIREEYTTATGETATRNKITGYTSNRSAVDRWRLIDDEVRTARKAADAQIEAAMQTARMEAETGLIMALDETEAAFNARKNKALEEAAQNAKKKEIEAIEASVNGRVMNYEELSKTDDEILTRRLNAAAEEKYALEREKMARRSSGTQAKSEAFTTAGTMGMGKILLLAAGVAAAGVAYVSLIKGVQEHLDASQEQYVASAKKLDEALRRSSNAQYALAVARQTGVEEDSIDLKIIQLAADTAAQEYVDAQNEMIKSQFGSFEVRTGVGALTGEEVDIPFLSLITGKKYNTNANVAYAGRQEADQGYTEFNYTKETFKPLIEDYAAASEELKKYTSGEYLVGYDSLGNVMYSDYRGGKGTEFDTSSAAYDAWRQFYKNEKYTYEQFADMVREGKISAGELTYAYRDSYLKTQLQNKENGPFNQVRSLFEPNTYSAMDLQNAFTKSNEALTKRNDEFFKIIDTIKEAFPDASTWDDVMGRIEQELPDLAPWVQSVADDLNIIGDASYLAAQQLRVLADAAALEALTLDTLGNLDNVTKGILSYGSLWEDVFDDNKGLTFANMQKATELFGDQDDFLENLSLLNNNVNPITGEKITAEEKQQTLNKMFALSMTEMLGGAATVLDFERLNLESGAIADLVKNLGVTPEQAQQLWDNIVLYSADQLGFDNVEDFKSGKESPLSPNQQIQADQEGKSITEKTGLRQPTTEREKFALKEYLAELESSKPKETETTDTTTKTLPTWRDGTIAKALGFGTKSETDKTETISETTQTTDTSKSKTTSSQFIFDQNNGVLVTENGRTTWLGKNGENINGIKNWPIENQGDSKELISKIGDSISKLFTTPDWQKRQQQSFNNKSLNNPFIVTAGADLTSDVDPWGPTALSEGVTPYGVGSENKNWSDSHEVTHEQKVLATYHNNDGTVTYVKGSDAKGNPYKSPSLADHVRSENNYTYQKESPVYDTIMAMGSHDAGVLDLILAFANETENGLNINSNVVDTVKDIAKFRDLTKLSTNIATNGVSAVTKNPYGAALNTGLIGSPYVADWLMGQSGTLEFKEFIKNELLPKWDTVQESASSSIRDTSFGLNIKEIINSAIGSLTGETGSSIDKSSHAKVSYTSEVEDVKVKDKQGTIKYKTEVENPELPKIKDQHIKITADDEASGTIDKVNLKAAHLDLTKNITVGATDNASALLLKIADKARNIKTNININVSVSGTDAASAKLSSLKAGSASGGIIGVNAPKLIGERYANGGTTGSNGLVGTWLGDQYNGSGEKKPELVVTPDGNAHIAGMNGWEYEQLPKGTRVFNNTLTKQLLGSNYKNGGNIGERHSIGGIVGTKQYKVGERHGGEYTNVVLPQSQVTKRYDDNSTSAYYNASQAASSSASAAQSSAKASAGSAKAATTAAKTAAKFEGYIEDISKQIEDYVKQYKTVIQVVSDEIELLTNESEKIDYTTGEVFDKIDEELALYEKAKAGLESKGATKENSSDYRELLANILKLEKDKFDREIKNIEHEISVLEYQRSESERLFDKFNNPELTYDDVMNSMMLTEEILDREIQHYLSAGYDIYSDEVQAIYDKWKNITEDIKTMWKDAIQRIANDIEKTKAHYDGVNEFIQYKAQEYYDDLTKEAELIQLRYDDETELYEKQDKLIDRQKRLQDAEADLADAQKKRVMVMTDTGWQWESNPESVRDALKALDDTKYQIEKEVRDETRAETLKNDLAEVWEKYYGEGSDGKKAYATIDSIYTLLETITQRIDDNNLITNATEYQLELGNTNWADGLDIMSKSDEMDLSTLAAINSYAIELIQLLGDIPKEFIKYNESGNIDIIDTAKAIVDYRHWDKMSSTDQTTIKQLIGLDLYGYNSTFTKDIDVVDWLASSQDKISTSVSEENIQTIIQATGTSGVASTKILRAIEDSEAGLLPMNVALKSIALTGENDTKTLICIKQIMEEFYNVYTTNSKDESAYTRYIASQQKTIAEASSKETSDISSNRINNDQYANVNNTNNTIGTISLVNNITSGHTIEDITAATRKGLTNALRGIGINASQVAKTAILH